MSAKAGSIFSAISLIALWLTILKEYILVASAKKSFFVYYELGDLFFLGASDILALGPFISVIMLFLWVEIQPSKKLRIWVKSLAFFALIVFLGYGFFRSESLPSSEGISLWSLLTLAYASFAGIMTKSAAHAYSKEDHKGLVVLTFLIVAIVPLYVFSGLYERERNRSKSISITFNENVICMEPVRILSKGIIGVIDGKPTYLDTSRALMIKESCL